MPWKSTISSLPLESITHTLPTELPTLSLSLNSISACVFR
jgi:hypothetical protein